MAALHNRINKNELKQKLQDEPFKRITLSFYRYTLLDNPQQFRDELYRKLSNIQAFGRIYVAREGINAQMSVPEHSYTTFIEILNALEVTRDIPLKIAVEDNGKSFYKLTIKVREKIVADGLEHGTFDVTNVGKHLTTSEFNQYLQQPDTIVVDMRNRYESEIGHFKNAILPDVDTFKEELDKSLELLQGKQQSKILLYCTGGIRCEKASAWLRHNGFTDVNQLLGGIIDYKRQIDAENLENLFIGRNFVFDERMAECITEEIISKCHQCGKPSARQVNCANDFCHVLFIQCAQCADAYTNCCSNKCFTFMQLPASEKLQLKPDLLFKPEGKYIKSKVFGNL